MSISDEQRVVVTGMAINTVLGDTLEEFGEALFAGRSGVLKWKFFDTSKNYSKVGGDLSGYDTGEKLASLKERLREAQAVRLRKLLPRSPWSTRLSMLLAADAFAHAGAADLAETDRFGAIVGGHNINSNFQFKNFGQYLEEPDYIDPLFGLGAIDTDHAGCISEVLGLRGALYTVGGACASGNIALRCAVDEIRHHGMDAVLVTGPVLDLSPLELHSLAMIGAISFLSFNDEPQRASRPYDVRREGFVPAHGGAALVVESRASARRRGARIHAEVLGVEANADASHLTQPSEDGQARLMQRVLATSGMALEQIDYINAHATSTPLGDLTELRAIKRVFGSHAYRLKLNATKSLLGHTCWAAPLVELVATILQMQAGRLHPSINIDQLDPEVDLDVCNGAAVDYPVRFAMKNSFGFGGINSVSILSTFES